MSFHAKLIASLKSDSRFVDEDGELVIAAVLDHAWRTDHGLVKLLLADKETRAKFFDEIDGHFVFDFNTFIQYISQKNFLNDSYTRFRNRIGLTMGGQYLRHRNEVVLAWPFKDCVLEGGQTKDEEKRKEIFFNEMLAEDEVNRLFAPKVLTAFARFTANGKAPVTAIARDGNGVIRENLIVQGNNLIALRSLMSQYRRQVDLIYIDPPFNPPSKSNTFAYNNTFNHSSWLTFMNNRLHAAKELLTEDGVLIVAIDDNELFYLGAMLDELFPEYEVHCITVVHNPRGVQGTNFSYVHEYALFVIPRGKKTIGDRRIGEEEVDWAQFRNWGGESLREDAKNCFYAVIVENDQVIGFGDVLKDGDHPAAQTVRRKNRYYVYPIDRNKVERKWRYARQSAEGIQRLLRARKTDGGYEIEIGKDFGVYRTVWEDSRYDANVYGTQLVKSLVPDCAFDFPKSLWTVFDCLYAVVGNKKNAIVLDFIAGSGTTGHAVLELNKRDSGERKFILCEQMDYVDTCTRNRVWQVIKNIGSGDFVYFELMKYNEAFLHRIEEAQTTKELIGIWNEMAEGSFLNWYVNPQVPEDAVKDFEALGKDHNALKEQKRLLAQLLDKNQLYVNLSEIDDPRFGVAHRDKALNKAFYAEAYDG